MFCYPCHAMWIITQSYYDYIFGDLEIGIISEQRLPMDKLSHKLSIAKRNSDITTIKSMMIRYPNSDKEEVLAQLLLDYEEDYKEKLEQNHKEYQQRWHTKKVI